MTIYILVCAVAACASGPIVITRMTDKCVANTVVENIYHSKEECGKRSRLSCGCLEAVAKTPNESGKLGSIPFASDCNKWDCLNEVKP